MTNFVRRTVTGAFIVIFVLGGLFVAVTLLLPRGLAGLFRREEGR